MLARTAPQIDFLSVHTYPCWKWPNYDHYRTDQPDALGIIRTTLAAIQKYAPAHRHRLRIMLTEFAAGTFGNCQEVELFLNSASLGQQRLVRNGHLEWKVPYAPGRLMAKGKNHGQVITHQVETTGPPRALVLEPDRATLTAVQHPENVRITAILELGQANRFLGAGHRFAPAVLLDPHALFILHQADPLTVSGREGYAVIRRHNDLGLNAPLPNCLSADRIDQRSGFV